MGQREAVIGSAGEAAGHQRVGEVVGSDEVEPGDRRRLTKHCSATEDGEGTGQVGAADGQSCELGLHAAAYLLRAERGEPRCDLGRRLDPFGDDLVDKGTEQERVAGAGGVACSDECRVCAGKPLGHQCLDRVGAQRSWFQRRLRCRGHQGGQRCRIRRGFPRAHRAQHAQG